MKAKALQNIVTRLIHEDKFRQEFEADPKKCLDRHYLDEAEKLALASFDLDRYLDALQSQKPTSAFSRAIKGGSTL